MEEITSNAILAGDTANEEVVTPQSSAEVEEVATPQSSAEVEEVATPQIDDMTDEEFANYLKSVENGEAPIQDAVKSEEAETGDAEPAEVEEETEVEETEEEAQEEAPFKVFKTQKDYQDNINGIISERLKKSREHEELLDKLMTQAKSFYGGDTDDVAISQLLDDLQAQNAEKRGVSVDEWHEQTQDAIDARRYREARAEEDKQQQEIKKIQDRWATESEQLKAVVPDFDFQKAMQNKDFYDSVVNGNSLAVAYMSANAKAKPKPQRREIRQVANSAPTRTGNITFNPETASDEDFRRYIARCQNGDYYQEE